MGWRVGTDLSRSPWYLSDRPTLLPGLLSTVAIISQRVSLLPRPGTRGRLGRHLGHTFKEALILRHWLQACRAMRASTSLNVLHEVPPLPPPHLASLLPTPPITVHIIATIMIPKHETDCSFLCIRFLNGCTLPSGWSCTFLFIHQFTEVLNDWLIGSIHRDPSTMLGAGIIEWRARWSVFLVLLRPHEWERQDTWTSGNSKKQQTLSAVRGTNMDWDVKWAPTLDVWLDRKRSLKRWRLTDWKAEQWGWEMNSEEGRARVKILEQGLPWWYSVDNNAPANIGDTDVTPAPGIFHMRWSN